MAKPKLSNEKRLKEHRAKMEAGRKLRERALTMKDKGYSNAAIADVLGISENTIRRLITPKLLS